ncbi:hypothetical protein SUGI_1189190 [Cryptomeria japonica]|nr:hypothetical protein SUGI_1189190 [Cryptomeria japonica]
MENEEGREILIFGKRIRVGGENNGSVSHENGNEKGEKRKYIKSLMPRIRWTSDLHDSFLRAVQQLGGPNRTEWAGWQAEVVEVVICQADMDRVALGGDVAIPKFSSGAFHITALPNLKI